MALTRHGGGGWAANKTRGGGIGALTRQAPGGVGNHETHSPPVRCIEVLMEDVGSRDGSNIHFARSSGLQVAPFALCSLFFIFT